MRTPKRLVGRNLRPAGEVGRYLTDEQFYRFYIELILNKESVLQASAKAGINRNTGYKLSKQFDALAPGEKHPRILNIENRGTNTVESVTWFDLTQQGKGTSSLRDKLDRLVVGQKAAKDAILENYEVYLAGMSPAGRPIGNFLFLGPTGSGKTHIVESTAEALAGDPKAVIKIDCAEYQHGHEIAKLIGSPPGYLGHRETHPLFSQEALDRFHTEKCKMSFVLFDEIEKASDALWNLLLGILDKAALTLGDNRRVDFARTLIFMTSNLGAREIQDLSAQKWFNVQKNLNRTQTVGINAAKKKFTEEFYNRLDYIIVFETLTTKETEQILELLLAKLQVRIIAAIGHSFDLQLSDVAQKEILRRGFNERYGIRELKRVLIKEIERPIARLINTGQIAFKHAVFVDFQEGKFMFGEPRRENQTGGTWAA